MNKSILVLDENSVIHGLVASALESEGLTLHHEFNPGSYVERASSLMPDLILIGNSATDPEYKICRDLKGSRQLAEVPVVLLAGSKEALTRDQLAGLRVAGVVRKPFEAADLQQQVSKHLDVADLIGSAYEYRRSQSSQEEASNPLANLDVLDDEVLGLLRGSAGPAEGEPPPEFDAADAPFDPLVVDDEVLDDALQPERAFEPVEVPFPPDAAAPRHDALETLESEFPAETIEPSEDGEALAELGAADVLEDDSLEEAVFEPQGFDQELGADGSGDAGVLGAELDDIEVELPDDGLDAPAMQRALDDESAELFESDLAGGDAEAEGPGPRFEEAIPLSVRRMMELKPVLTMTQEESAADEPALGSFDFDASGGEGQAAREALDDLGTVELDAVELDAAELDPTELDAAALDDDDDLEAPEPFDLHGSRDAALEPDEADAAEIGEEDAGALQGEFGATPRATPMDDVTLAQPPDDDEEYFVEEFLGDDELDEEQVLAAEEDLADLPELSTEDEADLNEMIEAEEQLADLEDEMDELDAMEASLDTDEAADAEGSEITLEREESERIHASLDSELDDVGSVSAEEVDTHEEPLFERNFNALDEERAAPGEDESWPLAQQGDGFALAAEDGGAPGEDVIALETPAEAMEEVPASALQEVDEQAASVEIGAARPGVFTREGEPPWKPKAPPSFVPRPVEDFPEAAVDEPFAGPSQEAAEPIPSPAPRHTPLEVLEDPDQGLPVFDSDTDLDPLREDASITAVSPEEVEALAAGVSLERVHGFESSSPDEESAEDPFAETPSAGAPGDDALEDAALEDLALEDAEPLERGEGFGDEAVEPGPERDLFALDAVEPGPDEEPALTSSDVTRGEVDALLADDGVAELDALEPEALPPEADRELDLLLGGELGDEEPSLGLADDLLEDEAPLDEAPDLHILVGAEDGDDADEPWDAAAEPEPDLPTGLDEAAASDVEMGMEAEAAPSAGAGEGSDPEFDNLFASLREEIAANPEGERLEDVLRAERIRDRVAALELSLPQHESTFARAMGIYALPANGTHEEAEPAAAPPPPQVAPGPDEDAAAREAVAAANAAAARSTTGATDLSLLDPDIRAKLGLVLDEIISISVRKAVQEEMPKLMERLSKGP